jgi:hypothetical protein
MRSSAFISYSHKDSKWLEKLQTMLAPLIRGGLNVWSDQQIKPGGRWIKEIESALADAKVAILLVSPNFLASEFIHNNELPELLNAAERDGLTILWIPVEDCLYEQTPIGDYQAVHSPAQPLASLKGAKVNQALKAISKAIAEAMNTPLKPSADD